ncbi:transmembrane amino acid transporter protein [Cryptosporidium andersoni]|uniref:Transmembrane amino acid transporter protein n=1 Tax=Cryptosporidium andersoni TaxID=117008 RepID=A0A1J4MQ00_9CRYT|nr:transmembrane amino acid transporter protein [Cryptosporidium andersoni]
MAKFSAENTSLLPTINPYKDGKKASLIERLSEQLIISMEKLGLRHVNKSSVTSAFFALVNTTMGVGVLGLPWAYSQNGLLQGILLTLLSGIFSILACVLLSEISLVLDKDGGNESVTYYTIAEKTFPKMKLMIDMSILVMSLGACSTYLIVVVSVLQTLFEPFFPDSMSVSTIRTLILFAIVIFVIGPASYPTTLAELTIINWIAVFSSLYVVIVVIYSFLSQISQLPILLQRVDLFSTNSAINLLQTFPIYVFSFTCHHNFLNVANELENKTLFRLIITCILSIGFCIIVYVFMGVSGYLLFGNTLKSSDILSMFDTSTTIILIARIVLVSSLVFSFPVSCHSFRKSLAIIIKGGQDADSSFPKDRYMLRSITLLFLFICTTIAFLTTDLGLTYELIGLFCSNTVCYFLPAILFLKVFWDKPLGFLKISATILLIFSVLVYPVCFSAILYPYFYRQNKS